MSDINDFKIVYKYLEQGGEVDIPGGQTLVMDDDGYIGFKVDVFKTPKSKEPEESGGSG